MADKTLSKEELIEAIKGMTVLELSEMVKALEEAFGVSAAAPMMAAAPAAAAAVEEVKDEFTVVLTAAGDKKIQVIKEVRAITALGLNLRAQILEPFNAAAGQHHGGAGAGQGAGKLRPEATRGAGNQGHPARKVNAVCHGHFSVINRTTVLLWVV